MSDRLKQVVTKTTTLMPGMACLEPGDIVEYSGKRWLVESSTESRARIIPLFPGVSKAVTFADGSVAVFTEQGRHVSISQHIPSDMLLERAGAEYVKTFLSTRRGSPGEADNHTTGAIGEASMINETDGLARGGLAAEALRAKSGNKPKAAKKEKKTEAEDGSKGKLGQLFGNSITSVIRKLANEGLTVAQITKALKAQKDIEVPAEATVKIQRGRGVRNDPAKDGVLATLTREQLKALKDAAGPVEKEETKAAKPAAKKSKGPSAKTLAAAAKADTSENAVAA